VGIGLQRSGEIRWDATLIGTAKAGGGGSEDAVSWCWCREKEGERERVMRDERDGSDGLRAWKPEALGAAR
jgi:hypothetical protein